MQANRQKTGCVRYMHVNIHMSMNYKHVHMYMHTDIYVCMYIYIYVCINVHMYIHIQEHIQYISVSISISAISIYIQIRIRIQVHIRPHSSRPAYLACICNLPTHSAIYPPTCRPTYLHKCRSAFRRAFLYHLPGRDYYLRARLHVYMRTKTYAHTHTPTDLITHTHIQACIRTYTYLCMHPSVHTYRQTDRQRTYMRTYIMHMCSTYAKYIHIHIYICICIHVYMYVCIYVCMYICVYVHMYICIYVHTHTYMCTRSPGTTTQPRQASKIPYQQSWVQNQHLPPAVAVTVPRRGPSTPRRREVRVLARRSLLC